MQTLKEVGRGGGNGTVPPQIFTSIYILFCVALQQYINNRTFKNGFSSCIFVLVAFLFVKIGKIGE
jgi:hypothetical protein